MIPLEKNIIANMYYNGIPFFRSFFFHFLIILSTIPSCLYALTALIRNSNGRDNARNAKLGEHSLKGLPPKKRWGRFKKWAKFDKFLDYLTRLLEKLHVTPFDQRNFPMFLVVVLFLDRLFSFRENQVLVSLRSPSR